MLAGQHGEAMFFCTMKLYLFPAYPFVGSAVRTEPGKPTAAQGGQRRAGYIHCFSRGVEPYTNPPVCRPGTQTNLLSSPNELQAAQQRQNRGKNCTGNVKMSGTRSADEKESVRVCRISCDRSTGAESMPTQIYCAVVSNLVHRLKQQRQRLTRRSIV